MGKSFHVEAPKTEKAREPTVETLVRGIWRLRLEYQKQGGGYGRVCQAEDSPVFTEVMRTERVSVEEEGEWHSM